MACRVSARGSPLPITLARPPFPGLWTFPTLDWPRSFAYKGPALGQTPGLLFHQSSTFLIPLLLVLSPAATQHCTHLLPWQNCFAEARSRESEQTQLNLKLAALLSEHQPELPLPLRTRTPDRSRASRCRTLEGRGLRALRAFALAQQPQGWRVLGATSAGSDG